MTFSHKHTWIDIHRAKIKITFKLKKITKGKSLFYVLKVWYFQMQKYKDMLTKQLKVSKVF